MSFPLLRSKRSASRLSARRSSRRPTAPLTLEQLERRELLAGEPLQITLEASTAPGGAALTGPLERPTNDTFFLNIYVQDMRSASAQGVTGGTLDLTWNSNNVSVTQPIQYGTGFGNAHSGTVSSSTTLVDELGASTSDTGIGVGGRVLFCSIEMTVTNGLPVTFSVEEGTTGMSLVGQTDLSSSDIAANTLTVTFTNTAPDVPYLNLSYTVLPGQTLTTTAAQGLLAQADDPEFDPVTLATVDGKLGTVLDPQYGTLSINADGSFTYVCNATLPEGVTSDSFTYRVTDGVASTDVLVNLDLEGNNAPTFDTPTYSIDVEEGETDVLTCQATDDTGDTLTYSISGDDAARFNIDADTGVLTFKAAPNFEAPGSSQNSNEYHLTVTATDSEQATAVQDLTVTVTNINDTPPTITGGESRTFTIPEHSAAETPVGQVVASDADGDTLQYSIIYNEDEGSPDEAFTIDATTGQITLITPNLAGLNLDYDDGTATVVTLTVQVTDGELTATQEVTIAVSDQNSAPTLTQRTTAFSFDSLAANQTDSTGTLVSAILNGMVSDADGSTALTGLAVIAQSATTGTWQYSLNDGTSWTAFGSVGDQEALLLRSNDRIRFLPNGTSTGTASFNFVAWDQTGTTSGQQGQPANSTSRGGTNPFSSAQDLATITITAAVLNTAPALDSTKTDTQLPAIDEDATAPTGVLVSDLVNDAISDSDSNTQQGIAVVNVTATSGKWQYQLNGSSDWHNIGSEQSATLSANQARLLPLNARIRFVPNANYSGTVTDGLTFRAWDQTDENDPGELVTVSATGEHTAFSANTAKVSITVNAINDAPVLTTTTFTLTTINEDPTSNEGSLVSALLDQKATDADGTTALGIAVHEIATSSNGHWEYKLASGEWTTFGTVSTTQAFLLAADARIRFVPNANASGTISNGLKFHAWDRSDNKTSGGTADVSTTGNATAFSSAIGNLSITVNAVNDAPVLTTTALTLTAINEDATTNEGSLISALLDAKVTDADGTSTPGIAVYEIATSTNGHWEYKLASGSWTTFGTVSSTQAFLLAADARIRFVPNANASGTISDGLKFRVWDRSDNKTSGGTADVSTNGNATAFSSANGSVSITINALNDVPTIDSIANLTIAKNAGQQTVNLTGITAGGGESQTLRVTASSGNTTLIPAANLSATYTSPNSTGTLTFTPASDQTGSAVITITVTDAGADGQFDTADDANTVKTFTVTVGGCSLSGYVYIDSDHDGTRESSDYGVSNVVITLQQLSNGSYVNYQTVVTGSDGSYSFKNLPAGTYQIVETQASNIRDGVATAGTSGGTVSSNTITAITLSNETAATGYNFGERGLALKYIPLRMCFTYSPTIEAIYTEMVGTSKVTISGTSSADTIVVTAGTEYHTITINGVQQQIAAAVDSVIIDAGSGTDTVTLTGTSEDDVAKIATSTASLISAKYALLVKAAETYTIKGGTGNDSAEISDSTGNDTLTASQSSIKISSSTTSGSTTTTIAAELFEFEKVKARATTGTDTVTKASALDYVLTLEGAWANG